MERATPPACDSVQSAARSCEPFFVSATLSTGRSYNVDLSPAAGPDCHGAATTVGQAKVSSPTSLSTPQCRSHYGLRHSGSRLHVVGPSRACSSLSHLLPPQPTMKFTTPPRSLHLKVPFYAPPLRSMLTQCCDVSCSTCKEA
jgi:hypothetical protein